MVDKKNELSSLKTSTEVPSSSVSDLNSKARNSNESGETNNFIDKNIDEVANELIIFCDVVQKGFSEDDQSPREDSVYVQYNKLLDRISSLYKSNQEKSSEIRLRLNSSVFGRLLPELASSSEDDLKSKYLESFISRYCSTSYGWEDLSKIPNDELLLLTEATWRSDGYGTLSRISAQAWFKRNGNDRYSEKVPDFVKNSSFRHMIAKSFIEDQLESNPKTPAEFLNVRDVESSLKYYLYSLGLEWNECSDVLLSWASVNNVDESGERDDFTALMFQEQFLDNFRTIYNLERKNPGIVARLHKERGIVHFSRFSSNPDLLLEQFDDVGDKKVEYLVLPYVDHNGAFADHVRMLMSASGPDYALKVIEVGSVQEMMSFLSGLVAQFGTTKNLVIGGHGCGDSLTFNEAYVARRPKEPKLNLSNIAGVAEQFRDMVQDGGGISLVSCSTGIEGGLAEELAKLTDRVVFAPVEPTNISGFSRDSFGRLQPLFHEGGRSVLNFTSNKI